LVGCGHVAPPLAVRDIEPTIASRPIHPADVDPFVPERGAETTPWLRQLVARRWLATPEACLRVRFSFGEACAWPAKTYWLGERVDPVVLGGRRTVLTSVPDEDASFRPICIAGWTPSAEPLSLRAVEDDDVVFSELASGWFQTLGRLVETEAECRSWPRSRGSAAVRRTTGGPQ
jgi:hypothetical protein